MAEGEQRRIAILVEPPVSLEDAIALDAAQHLVAIVDRPIAVEVGTQESWQVDAWIHGAIARVAREYTTGRAVVTRAACVVSARRRLSVLREALPDGGISVIEGFRQFA